MINKINPKVIYSFCAKEVSVRTPKPPKLLSGELQTFKYDFETSKLYDGYNLDQLYGSKMGVKHPPVVRAQMKKDTIASLLVFGISLGIILHIDWLFRQQHQQIKAVNDYRLSRNVKMDASLNNMLSKQ